MHRVKVSSSLLMLLLLVTASAAVVVVIRSSAGASTRSRHDPSQSDPAQLGTGPRPRGLVAAVLARVGFEVRGRGGARGPDGQVADADLAGRDGGWVTDAGGLCGRQDSCRKRQLVPPWSVKDTGEL